MNTVCNDYSETCVETPPTISEPGTLESLPLTGFSYGDTVLVALCLILVGLAVWYLTKPRSAGE